MATKKPKSFDIEMHFKWNNEARYLYVNVKECPVCPGIQVFITACAVCGRFSPKDRPIYFQPARSATLESVDHDRSLEGIAPKPISKSDVTRLPSRPTPTSSDDGPEAS